MNRVPPRQRFIRLAAALLVFALGFGPALHGAHTPHASRGLSIEAPALTQDASHDAATCPVCAALSQARTALTPTAMIPAAATTFVVAEHQPRDARRPSTPSSSPASPRAPPA